MTHHKNTRMEFRVFFISFSSYNFCVWKGLSMVINSALVARTGIDIGW